MAANQPEATRLLSIQSHVVCGYVGNRSATFPLQLLGWEVDVINTVQFSNHTGFGRWGGMRFDEKHIDDLVGGLDKNGLLRYARVLTGYIPSPNALLSVQRAVKRLRQLNPSLIYVLDPVMGDIGRGMYVNPDVLPIYKSMLPLSSIITPNQFEAEILTDKKITSLDTLLAVLQTLHVQHRVPHVLITSVELPDEDLHKQGIARTQPDGSPLMLLVGSSVQQTLCTAVAEARPWYIQFPEVEGYFSGVGDLFAAMIVGRYMRPAEAQSAASSAFSSQPASPAPQPAPSATSSDAATPPAFLRTPSAMLDEVHSAPTPLSRAAELAIASVQAVLAKTSEAIAKVPPMPTRQEWEASRAATADGPTTLDEGTEEAREKAWEVQKKVEIFRRRELKIVQSQKQIDQPIVRYKARWLLPNA
ncbi:pyridoxal kinase [Tilletiaria anomala UBC 951]|uniref:pyridoxal kinase n=1 Tax=Tilletiaria anomala (strain ATCC 24038 / CBS 436.72 / UBC 951) TaxID=1037660 RepID=A0A066WHD5_TILAU|nr:pyridoxal kinase [Tilletiaria anomala UBC 951]KDN53387.1 pyridoxal kinase [Tilletiaria anomala UBC 951]